VHSTLRAASGKLDQPPFFAQSCKVNQEQTMCTRSRWITAAVAVAVCCCVLGFYRASDASQRGAPPAKPPFASAVDQRFETIKELKGIAALLKEQNTLLKEQTKLLKSMAPDAAKTKRP
jgi:hypothetical protein